MDIKLLTVCFGGEWNMRKGDCTYDGDVNSKAFVLDSTVNLDNLKNLIIERFKIGFPPSEVKLSHLHPSKTVPSPYTIETDEDLESFYQINNTTQVAWGLPIYVTTYKKREDEDHAIEHQQQLSSDLNSSCQQSTNINNCHQQLEVCEHSEVDHSEEYQLIQVGQIYQTKEELKAAVYNLAMHQSFGFKVKRSTKNYYSLKCVHDTCEWKMVAVKLKEVSCFEVRKYNDKHTCPSEVRCSRKVQPSYQLIRQKMKLRFEGVCEGPNPKMIRNDMKNECLQNISYWKAWKAQEWAQVQIRGTPEQNYKTLPSYCYMLEQVNNGTYTCIEIGNDKHFKYVFIAIGASIRGFQQMKKVIQIDDTHLHNKYLGCLITASAQDANHQIYLIAYAIVDSENDNSWNWFFEQLLKVVPDSSDLVFVSNQYLSIEKSIESVYICAKHVICTRHLKQNLKTRFKHKDAHKLFKQAAESYTTAEFNKYFQDICRMNAEMGSYLREANIEKWSRAYFSGDRYNIMTIDNSDSINSVLKDARSFPVVALLEHIRDLLSKWFSERRAIIEANNNQLPPNISKMLEERCKKSKQYGVKVLNNKQFKVFIGDFSSVVDLEQKRCTCRMFDLDKMPCVHAIAAIQQMNYELSYYISEYYQHKSWSMAYQETIYPLPLKSEWELPEHVTNIVCHPPNVRRKSGRPRKTESFP